MTEQCGCEIHQHLNHNLSACNRQMCPMNDWIEYCPTHAKVFKFKEALEKISHAASGEWDTCAEIAKQALDKK